jgi:hypothetical protein
MEQFEDGVDDHNVLAKCVDETAVVTNEIQSLLKDFVLNVFRHLEGTRISVGQFLGVQEAEAHVMANLERA